ncbi:MAG: biotin/lipoyl-containing protein [Bacteroidia bacterium]
MYKAKVNGKDFEIKPAKTANTFLLNDEEIKIDLIKLKEGSFHILQKNKSYNVEVVNANHEEKIFEISVNGNNYTVHLKDRYDELLHRLGMDEAASLKVINLKAPMPGLVVQVHVMDGQQVKSGDVLVTLEAMKMENALKATGDAIVKKVSVKKGATVEKNQVLVYLT